MRHQPAEAVEAFHLLGTALAICFANVDLAAQQVSFGAGIKLFQKVELEQERQPDFPHSLDGLPEPHLHQQAAGLRKPVRLAGRSKPDALVREGHQASLFDVPDVRVEEALFDGADFCQVVAVEVAGHLVSVHWLQRQQAKHGEFPWEQCTFSHDEACYVVRNYSTSEYYMEISGRNQLKASVKEVNLGGIMAEVVMELEGGAELVAAITRKSAERLDLKPGDSVLAVIKATEVMIGR